MNFHIDSIRSDEYPAIAALIHDSLVNWYESRLGQGARFGDRADPFLIFPEVYETLDPGEGIVARDAHTGELLGVCFVHPRETHHAVGIVATSSRAGGRGVARALMEETLRRAAAARKPTRLVSCLLDLASSSLYTKLGFVPQTIFQDLLLTIPPDGLGIPAPPNIDSIRPARPDEAARLADFEASLQSLRREQDYRFFLENAVGNWKVWVSEAADGSIKGVLVVSLNPAMQMLGPGATTDEETALAMVWQALDELRGSTYVLLVPASASTLVSTLYRWGARNIELHVSQVHGESPAGSGIVFPTFLPESA